MRQLLASAVLSLALAAPPARAGVVWDESTNGNLSTSQSAPSAATLAPGTNSVIGSVTGGTDQENFIALTVPAGNALTGLILTTYTSTDRQGFMGFQTGATFVGSFL